MVVINSSMLWTDNGYLFIVYCFFEWQRSVGIFCLLLCQSSNTHSCVSTIQHMLMIYCSISSVNCNIKVTIIIAYPVYNLRGKGSQRVVTVGTRQLTLLFTFSQCCMSFDCGWLQVLVAFVMYHRIQAWFIFKFN